MRRRAARRAIATIRTSPLVTSSASPPTVPKTSRSTRSPSRRSASSEPDTTKPEPGDSPKRVSLEVRRAGRGRATQPMPPARHDSATATRKPPSATSWALDSDPSRTASRIASCAARSAAMSIGGSSDGSSSPRSFASSEPGRRGRNGPAKPDRVAGAQRSPSARRARRRAARRPCRRPASGRSARRRSRCRARRCRRRPARRAPGTRRPGRGSTRSAATRCAASRGCRSSGSSSGRAARRPRTRGSPCIRAPPRPCPCTGRTRRAGPSRRSRPRSRRRPAAASTAASACSGRRTVRDCTMQSYCSNSGSREAMFGEASSASSDHARDRSTSQRASAAAPGTARPPAARATGRTAGSRRPAPRRASRRRSSAVQRRAARAPR